MSISSKEGHPLSSDVLADLQCLHAIRCCQSLQSAKRMRHDKTRCYLQMIYLILFHNSYKRYLCQIKRMLPKIICSIATMQVVDTDVVLPTTNYVAIMVDSPSDQMSLVRFRAQPFHIISRQLPASSKLNHWRCVAIL